MRCGAGELPSARSCAGRMPCAQAERNVGVLLAIKDFKRDIYQLEWEHRRCVRAAAHAERAAHGLLCARAPRIQCTPVALRVVTRPRRALCVRRRCDMMMADIKERIRELQLLHVTRDMHVSGGGWQRARMGHEMQLSQRTWHVAPLLVPRHAARKNTLHVHNVRARAPRRRCSVTARTRCRALRLRPRRRPPTWRRWAGRLRSCTRRCAGERAGTPHRGCCAAEASGHCSPRPPPPSHTLPPLRSQALKERTRALKKLSQQMEERAKQNREVGRHLLGLQQVGAGARGHARPSALPAPPARLPCPRAPGMHGARLLRLAVRAPRRCWRSSSGCARAWARWMTRGCGACGRW